MKRPSNKTIALCVALFLVFLVLRFPYRNVRGYVFGQIYKSTGIRIDAEDLSPTFFGWPGVKLHKASAAIPLGTGSEVEVAAEQITARVGIGGVFPPAPLISVYAYKLAKGGNLYIRGSQSRSYVSGSLSAENVELGQFTSQQLSDPIEGVLRATGNFGYDMGDLAKSTGAFDLFISKLHIPGMNLQGIVLPAIRWDEVKAALAIKNGSLEIAQCVFGTPQSEMRGSLNGYLRLGKDVPSSYLNLVLRIQLTEKFKKDPQSATLVSFLNSFESSTKPGEYGLKWGATIRDMGSNIMLALPTKME